MESSDKETSLHAVETVATIPSGRPYTELQNVPTICSSTDSGHVCIALDASVVALDESYRPQCIIKAESSVDCLVLGYNATFLFICTNDGNIAMIHLAQDKCILKKCLIQVEDRNDETSVFQNVFCFPNLNKGTSEIVILSAKTIFHFVDIHLEKIGFACEDSNNEELQNILAEISNYEVCLNSIGGSAFTTLDCSNFLLTWDAEEVRLMLLDSHEILRSTSIAAFQEEYDQFHGYVYNILTNLGANVTKAKICKNGQDIFILDNSKVMNVMCLTTFLVVDTITDLEIKDFTLIESFENSSFNTFDVKLLVLTGMEAGSCALGLYHFPSLKLMYSIDVCPFSYIIDIPPNHDCILFLEGCKGDVGEILTSIKVKKITEASHEAQLSRLLNKCMFEEAILFASKFNMNSEVIYKTKANYLLEHLSRNEKTSSPQKTAIMKSDLYSCLDKISDIQHIITFCVNTSFPSLTDTFDMFLYAKLKLSTSGISVTNLCDQIFQTLKKLETFQLIHGESQFSSNWDDYLRADPWEELLRYLFHKKLDVASLLWEHHVEDFLSFMDKNDVIQLLNSIPEALISDTLYNWLSNSVFPVILSRIQGSLEGVAAWVIKCSSMLELTDKAGWPVNAINFTQMLLNVCQHISSHVLFCGVKIDMDMAMQIGKSMQHENESVLPKLHKLLDNLHDLKELRQVYNCKISLADYSQENKQAVVFHLLEWVNSPDEIPEFVKNFLKPYTSRNSLRIDDVIQNYIMDVMEYTEFNWWLRDEPPWEKQIIVLIHCLEDEELYLNAICKMLQTIPVPWSEDVHNMVNKSLKLKHPLVESIKLEIGNIAEKTVLTEYGFRRINLSDIEVAETVMRHIIVKSIDNETFMQHASIIAKNAKLDIADAYIFRMKHLVQCEKLSDCLILMKSLPADIAVQSCKRLANFARSQNLFMEDNESSSLSNYLFLKVGIYALYHLKSLISSFDFENYADLLLNLENSLAFQVNFGVYLSINKLDSERNCVQIFEENVESFLCRQELNFSQGKKLNSPNVETERKLCEGNPVFQHLFQIGSLLNLKRVTALEIIAKKSFALEKYDYCIDASLELCDLSPITVNGNILLGLIRYIFNEWCKNAVPSAYVQPLINMLDRLLATASVVCEPDLLESCASLSPWIFLLKTMRYRCHTETLDFTNTISLSGADAYNEWSCSTIFKETALQLDLENILPYLNTCIQNIFIEENSFCRNCHILSQKTITSVTDLIRQLKKKGQLLLAYSVYAESLATFLISLCDKVEYLEIFSQATTDKQKLTLSILQIVFGQSSLDYLLSLGLLLNLPKDNAIFALQTTENRCGFDYRKLQHIAIVGEEFSEYWVEAKLVAYYRMLQKESEWGRKFSKLHINFKDAFRGNSFEKMRLMQQIANQPQITFPAIQSYCSAFDLELDEALLITLDVLLTFIYNERPHLAATRQSYRSQSQALNICSQVVREIKNKKSAFEKLNMIYLKTDPYNYEILEFILESAVSFALYETCEEVEKAEKGLILLQFLKTYKRISEPTEFEIELWLENSEFSIQNEQIKERLPYHSLLVRTEAVKILVSELTADTVDVWLKIADCLKIHKNEIIMMTVENLVRQIIPKLGPSLTRQQAWVVMVPNKQLLYVICDLISRIDDLEKATACATSVVKRLPPSYCKLYATMGAISFAKNWWEETQSRKAEHARNLLQKLHSSLYTDLVLYEHGLNEAQYSSLNEQPQELICRLYEHQSIEQRYWLDSNKFPDIHGACEKIAGVTQCDLEALRMSLLSKWILPTEYLSGALDETIIENFCVPTFDPEFEDEPVRNDRNFKRSIYLLQKGCVEENASVLVDVMLSNVPTVSYGHKLRALKCLLHIADEEAIERLARVDFSDFRVFGKHFFFGSQLELLHFPCELPLICNPASTHDLVVQLLQNQSQHPIALTLAADLCFDSNFYNLQIWNTILRRMIDSKMYKPLREVLFLLSSHPLILHMPEFFKAWSTILKDDTVDNDEPARGLNNIILLHRCPLLHELDLLSLAEYFNQVSLHVLTIDCFLHLPNRSVRYEIIRAYLTASMVPLVLQHLKELRDVASTLYHLDEITKVVFLLIAKIKLDVTSKSLLVWYEEFILQDKELTCLVIYALKNDLQTECAAVLQKNISLNSESEFAKEVKKQNAEGFNIVKVYTDINKLDMDT